MRLATEAEETKRGIKWKFGRDRSGTSWQPKGWWPEGWPCPRPLCPGLSRGRAQKLQDPRDHRQMPRAAFPASRPASTPARQWAPIQFSSCLEYLVSSCVSCREPCARVRRSSRARPRASSSYAAARLCRHPTALALVTQHISRGGNPHPDQRAVCRARGRGRK